MTTFNQMENESFYDTKEKFQDLLRKYPYRGIQPWVKIQTFYNGLMTETKSIVDATIGRSIVTKTYEDQLMKKLASYHHQMLMKEL